MSENIPHKSIAVLIDKFMGNIIKTKIDSNFLN